MVPFLNGLEHVDALRQAFGQRVAAGTVRVASIRSAPGVIKHSSPFVRIEIAIAGDLDGHCRETARKLASHLVGAGVDVEIQDDELSMLWGKLIFLCPLALLTTRYGVRAGDVRTSYRDDLVAVIDEISRVGAAVGAQVNADAALAFFDSVPAAMGSSMQHDAAAGNPIELDGIGGAVLRAAARSGIPAPVTERLVRELHERGVPGSRRGSAGR